MSLLFEAAVPFTVPIAGSEAEFPVRRIFCVGRNYEKHAAEMGNEVDREAPWYFTKSPANAVLSGATIPYPQGTEDFHHEMELAVYLGSEAIRATIGDAVSSVLGYSCALDMTRRDLQKEAKDKRRPWDLGKDVENGTVLSPITLDWSIQPDTRIHLEVNDKVRQDATLDELVWPVPDVIAHLSRFYRLGAGDVILTGTPAGVGPVEPGDVITGGIDGLEPIEITIGEME